MDKKNIFIGKGVGFERIRRITGHPGTESL